MHTLFKASASGPYALPVYIGKGGQKAFDQLCEQQHLTFQADLSKTKSGHEDSGKAQLMLQEIDSAKRRKTMESARAKAEQTFAAKRAKRTINLEVDTLVLDGEVELSEAKRIGDLGGAGAASADVVLTSAATV